uniref:RNA-binding protein 6 n=1 Tax=Strongyloides papillosus TaxID=174720 RepID=A0A0N5C5M9_STREA
MYSGRYGSYERFDSYERHGPRRHPGPHGPPPRQHDFGMRSQRPMMDHRIPMGMRRPGPDFPPPPMGPRGRHHH